MKKFAYATVTAVSAAALFAATAQADETRSFSDVRGISFERVTGTVDIRIGGDRITVEKKDGADAAYPVTISSAGGSVEIIGEDEMEDRNWYKKINWKRNHEDAFKEYLKSYPTFIVTVPAGMAVSFDDAVVSLNGGDLNGDFYTRGGYVDGKLGDLASADIGIHSSADLAIGDVAGDLALAIHGSGDFSGGRAATAVVSIHGSGDVLLQDIGGPADVSIHGSGDVSLGDVGGAIAIEARGSGDVAADAVNGGAEIGINGSSDVSLASVSGPTSVDIRGSGDVEIKGGRAQDLQVVIAGSGDFSHLGLATNARISLNGSGNIYVHEHEGPVNARGRGDIRVGGVEYGNDD